MIEQLDVAQLDGLADVWSMSPPCQPFTTCTSAKQLGSEDKRSRAFANLMRVRRVCLFGPLRVCVCSLYGGGAYLLCCVSVCLSACGVCLHAGVSAFGCVLCASHLKLHRERARVAFGGEPRKVNLCVDFCALSVDADLFRCFRCFNKSLGGSFLRT